MIHSYTRHKVPHFFIYAKDKTEAQVEPQNDSAVNRLEYIIPTTKLNFQKQTLGKFDPKVLMSSSLVPQNEITAKVIETYNNMTKSEAMRMKTDDNGQLRSTYGYQTLIDALDEVCPSRDMVVDILVKELFIKRKSRRKNIFWMCYGDIVAGHIKSNLGTKTGMCIRCGRRFYRESNRQVMCRDCAAKAKRVQNAAVKRRAREKCHHLEKTL